MFSAFSKLLFLLAAMYRGPGALASIILCMLILSFTVRSLSDLANLPITFWSSSQIAHDARTVREHTVEGKSAVSNYFSVAI
jgi:hypothetical protein